jgi:hypothetical protein
MRRCKHKCSILFEPNFQICQKGTLGFYGLIEYKTFQQLAYLLKIDRLGDVCSQVIVLHKRIFKNDLDVGFAEHMKLKLIPGFGEMDHRIDAIPH